MAEVTLRDDIKVFAEVKSRTAGWLYGHVHYTDIVRRVDMTQRFQAIGKAEALRMAELLNFCILDAAQTHGETISGGASTLPAGCTMMVIYDPDMGIRSARVVVMNEKTGRSAIGYSKTIEGAQKKAIDLLLSAGPI